MRTNASIPRRQIGQVRSVWLQLVHADRCPHGMQAKRFSSFSQITHGLLRDNLISEIFSASLVGSAVVSIAIGSMTADGAALSFSLITKLFD